MVPFNLVFGPFWDWLFFVLHNILWFYFICYFNYDNTIILSFIYAENGSLVKKGWKKNSGILYVQEVEDILWRDAVMWKLCITDKFHPSDAMIDIYAFLDKSVGL